MLTNVFLALCVIMVYLLFPRGIIGRLLANYRYQRHFSYKIEEVPVYTGTYHKRTSASYRRRMYKPVSVRRYRVNV